ncbi:Resolvase domain-containing protein [Fictibacillus macauensis ZFHKF-1]|uniref:Resolvase domain-containing protein n=1 Tax=Fictibacillus macauensis ZFHKF-1 TaxID=1196324 RepID=I8UGP1_9BACL|nr:recombinase family protein [Fictibacillus macauensis]EIT85958.1 Resolvase domain-containing protein [Fictibacillus macauensis ZFHKF-1]
MKAALYPRVSTEEQSKEGYSLNAQLEKMRAYCFSQGWTIYKEYTEEGKSAKNMERPQLQSLLKDMDKFDVVIVYKLDRLSRNVSDINTLLNTFEKNKVAFKSVTEPYDTTTAQGKLLINIFASLAQFEREQLAERTHMGMNRKHEEGLRNGGRAPFGYQFDADRKLIINEQEAVWVRYMFDSFEVRGKNAIAKQLNEKGVRTRTGALWNKAAVDYVVTNPVYCGMLRWNYRTKRGNRTYEEVVVPGDHEPIVSKEVYEKIKATRKNRRHSGFKGHAIYPFTGILKCARCGNNLIGAKRKRSDGSLYRFYKCTGRFTYGICDMPVIAEDTIEQEFVNDLSIEDVPVDLPEEEKQETAEIEKELKRIRNRMEVWKEMRADGDLTKQEFRTKMDAEQEKETALIQSLEDTRTSIDPVRIKMVIETLKRFWPITPLEEKKASVKGLFKSITIECIKSHTGGAGERAVIELTDKEYAFI